MENKKYKFVKIEALPESSAKKFKVILENLSTKRTKTIQLERVKGKFLIMQHDDCR